VASLIFRYEFVQLFFMWHAKRQSWCEQFTFFVGSEGKYSNRNCLSCVTFWIVLRRMVFNSRHFGTLSLFHLHRQVDAKFRIHLPMKMEQTQCSETSAIKHHMSKNNPESYTRHTEHGESSKSRNGLLYNDTIYYVTSNIFCTAKPAEKLEVDTSRLHHKIELYCRRKLTLNSW
jgi:hypothetical protein